MKYTKNEIVRIFDFILANKSIDLSSNLFNRDTLITLRKIIKDEIPNKFELSKEQESALIRAFIDSNIGFDSYTPQIILEDKNCISEAIKIDINSINYINYFDDELKEEVLNLISNNSYSLSYESPDFLKNDYDVCLKSIRKDVYTADFINWDDLSNLERNILLRETIQNGYILAPTSHEFLKNNLDIVLSSLMRDINTIQYANDKIKNHPQVLKQLIRNDYMISMDELKKKPIASFLDEDVMQYALNKSDAWYLKDADFLSRLRNYGKDNIKYQERINKLFVKGLNRLPTIENFKTVLIPLSNELWEEYKEENINDLANIFPKICMELRNNNNFNDAICELTFLRRMHNVLRDKYNILIKAMEEYHQIIHSNKSLELLEASRNQIARLSALYISMSKENYKKEQLDEFDEEIDKYFIPRKDHPLIKKKIIEYKQKEQLKELFYQKDSYFNGFLHSIANEWQNIIDSDIVWRMIECFIQGDCSKFSNIVRAPVGFNCYIRYLEAKKLINRLNSHYIKYTDQELVRYLDIIKYDDKTGKYFYYGPSFTTDGIEKFNEYRKKQYAFEKIKQKIVFEMKKIKVDNTISDEELLRISDSIPFTDEYFEFNPKIVNEDLNFMEFYDTFFNAYYLEPDCIMDDETYHILTDYIVKNSLIWLALILDHFENKEFAANEINADRIADSFDEMYNIVKLSKLFNIDIHDYESVNALKNISECADEKALAILGKDVILKLFDFRQYTEKEIEEIINIAEELVSQMAKRDRSTVPYIHGKLNNYEYSMYDSNDEEVLLAGINTNACFRVDGADNDFLHYCVLDKNGFIIKINDIYGNFVARASGFRNGNCVYINQLRSIYDIGGVGYEGNSNNELKEIIETFIKACGDIVTISQNNSLERDKIDFVFVTKSYAMSDELANVPRDVTDKIGDNPMERDSLDWENFVFETENLQEIDSVRDYFSTDYGNYPLICVASSKDIFNGIDKIKCKDIRHKDVKPLYERKRNKVIITNQITEDIIRKINKINGIYNYLNLHDYVKIVIPDNSLVYVGDNWYIICCNGKIINSCLLDFDNNASIEYWEAIKMINDNIINSKELSQKILKKKID